MFARINGRTLALVLVIGLSSLVPIGVSDYGLHIAIVSLFYVLMACSWNLIAGYTGQVSFAHAAFAAVGAYSSGLLAIHLGAPVIVSILFGALLAALLGFALGCLCLPLGGTYLSLVTLGFSEVLRLVLTNEDRWTRGTMGLRVPDLFSEYSKVHAYYVFLAVGFGVIFAMVRLIHSRLGLQFRAVMDDEVAAASLGVPTARIRVLAFSLSSAVAGLAGALYGHYLALISPDLATLGQMFLVLTMAMVGGLGTLWGPVVGAVSLEVLSELIRPFGEYHLLVFGLIALAVIRWRHN